jgi:hypothetical protein
LQTQFGDIYAQKGITGTAAPSGIYNATYRILSGGQITGFASAQAEALWVEGSGAQINFPTAETRYSNALGQLDADGLVCDCMKQATNPCNTCTNKYGIDVVRITTTILNNPNKMLDGKIYYLKSNLILPTNPSYKLSKFLNGSDFSNGAGTIVIDGDLTINQDMTYDTGSASKFRNLASAVWIIKGDLKIKGSVRNLAGNFIVLGNGTACAETGVGPDHCGQIFSCYDNICPANGQPLIVSGMVMARKFNFTRLFVPQPPLIQASESVNYDGRLLANTPPGLSDFAKAMPVWRPGVSQ